jgi:uncharacterized SAM-binding protein YcdF (DUF218 family)
MVGRMGDPQRVDAIVLLGCRIAASGRPLASAMRRAETAARAYHLGVAPRIVVSGGRRWGAHAEATALGRELARAGVPESAIVEELCSLSTHENAIFSAAVLRRLDARSAAIVTCWWHMPRALENFRAAGVDAIAIPTDAHALGLRRRTYLFTHELVCTWFDARARTRADALRAGAEHLAGAP